VADQNDKVREAWNTNARFWDSRLAEGNDWFNVLIWPRVETLLQMRQGDTVLDIACGNGLTSRRLARGGARVVAFDFSEQMIRLAKERGGNDGIDYRVVDATDADALSGRCLANVSKPDLCLTRSRSPLFLRTTPGAAVRCPGTAASARFRRYWWPE
jgi:SAM-dependent methyltransferase